MPAPTSDLAPTRPRSARRPTPRGVLAALLGLACALPAFSQDGAAPRMPSPEARMLVLESHGRPVVGSPGELEPQGLQDDYDVLHYDIELFVDPSRELLDGLCTITLRSKVASLGLIELDLHFPEFVVRAIERPDRPGALVEAFRDGDKLMLELVGERPAAGEEIRLAIDYVGRPRREPGRSPAVSFEAGGVDGHPRVHSFAEPFNARGWWPCKDRPDDKATVDLSIEAPQALQVVAGGRRVGFAPGRDGFRITKWSHEHPVATYLVGFSAAVFASWNEPWDWVDPDGTGRRMTVHYWAWPELAAWAYQDFARTVPMIDALSERFGPYPFSSEKYGLVMFGEDGAMEHQTATGIGGGVVALSRGSGAIENLLIHELAHHWWGNSVGVTDWDSIWLKEGLATWSEALWWEENGGLPAYLEYLGELAHPPGGLEFQGSVHAPEDLFGATVYYKGAWVMHMLRYVLSGPSIEGEPGELFELLRAWARGRADGTATTAEFVDFVSRESGSEAALGGPLHEWFFPQWLEREGRPRYAVDVASRPADEGVGFTAHLRIEQRQDGEPYAMPLHLRLHQDDGSIADRTYFVSSRSKDLTAWTERRVVAVELDPLGWVLKAPVEAAEIDLDDDGWPDWLDSCPEVPDATQSDENENGLGDACEPGLDFDGDGRPNQDDCAPADEGAWTPPRTDTLLRVENAGGGFVRLLLQHPDPAGQRAYRGDIAIGALVSLRAEGGMRSALCLADDLDGEVFETALSFAALGTYWTALPQGGCPELTLEPTRSKPCP